METRDYICPNCKAHIDVAESGHLKCSNGHSFQLATGTKIPVFAAEENGLNEYTIQDAAEIHDNALSWLFTSFHTDESVFRNNLVSRLYLKAGQRVLITGVGAGNDLPLLAQGVDTSGTIFAQDLSQQMLLSAVDRARDLYGLDNYKIEFCVSDATNLPYRDDFFDAVYHFGGLNLFTDIAKGIAEMDRVVREGGRVVFGDEGLAPWLRDTEYGKIIINNNQICDFEAPLQYLPHTAKEVRLSWEVGYCFYVIDYTASSESLPLNIDVPHIGKRGGSMRTRYFGKLEGVDPAIKATIYSEAEARGISRVKFLEFLLKQGLQKEMSKDQ